MIEQKQPIQLVNIHARIHTVGKEGKKSKDYEDTVLYNFIYKKRNKDINKDEYVKARVISHMKTQKKLFVDIKKIVIVKEIGFENQIETHGL